jgi:protein-disulfide isomerase
MALRWARRVYYSLPLLLLLGLGGGAARAQVELSVEPTMTRGALNALVTIVEFSDYQ